MEIFQFPTKKQLRKDVRKFNKSTKKTFNPRRPIKQKKNKTKIAYRTLEHKWRNINNDISISKLLKNIESLWIKKK